MYYIHFLGRKYPVSFTQLPVGPATRERETLNKEIPMLDNKIREKIIDDIKGEIRRYFPNDRIRLMSVLNPKNFPETIISVHEFTSK